MKKKILNRFIMFFMIIAVGTGAAYTGLSMSHSVYTSYPEPGGADGQVYLYLDNRTDEQMMQLIRANYFSRETVMEILNMGRCLGYYETLKAEGWIPQDFVPTSMQSSSNSSTSSQTSTSTPTTEPEKTYTDEEIAAAWKETSRTEPTCTKAGVIKYKNSITGKTKTEEIPVIEHSYEVSEQIPATCTEDGKITYTCTMCEDSYEEVITKTEHDYQETSRTDVTCTEDGMATYVCVACEDTYTDAVSSTGHTEGEWTTTKEARAFTEGEKSVLCTVCGEVLETEIIPQTSAISLPAVLVIGVVAIAGVIGVVILVKKK